MKKQIIYAKFISRLFAMCIDLIILSIVIAPIINFYSKNIFVFIFFDFFKEHNINILNSIEVFRAIRTQEFLSYLSELKLLLYISSIILVNIIFIGGYFIYFGYKFSATPGKIFMRIKVVDKDTFIKPTTLNLVKRFFCYITIIIGIWPALFSQNKQALHDKIANTVVIKI